MVQVDTPIKRIKVLHVINSMLVGGAEMLVSNILANGGLQDHVDNVLIYWKGRSHLVDRIDKRVKVICLDYTRFTDLPRALRQLRSIIKSESPDIVHTHLNPAGFYTRLVLPSQFIQLHTLHTCYSKDKETRKVLKVLERNRLFRHRNTRLIFLSEFLRKDFMSEVPFKGETYILPNCISDSFFHEHSIAQHESPVFKIVAVGNIRAVKNYKYILEIFRHLKGKPFQLDIYGNGADKTEYQSMIDELGIAVEFKGQSNELSKVLPQYDLFLMSSLFEGYPLSVIEAMASGLPVCISDIPVFRDLVQDKGVYFQLDNAAGAAKCLEELRNDRERLKELSRVGLAFANKVGRRNNYIESLLNIYSMNTSLVAREVNTVQ